MKKKILFIVIVFIFASGFLYAQDGMKIFSSAEEGESEEGFKGVSLSVLIDVAEIDNVTERFESVGTEMEQLSEQDYWLCWKGLDKWELNDGEVYLIVIGENANAEVFTMIIAEIEKDGETFSWVARSVRQDELK